MLLSVRNRINHYILNRLLGFRYRWRKRPRLKQAILLAEALCLKSGLIFNGRRTGDTPGDVPASRGGAGDLPDNGPSLRAHRHV
jgi:hypothetical protein